MSHEDQRMPPCNLKCNEVKPKKIQDKFNMPMAINPCNSLHFDIP